jgi:tetratricopeptide (TPR) repeat protein
MLIQFFFLSCRAAWLDLASTLKDGAMLTQVANRLPSHFFKPFWRAHCYLELQQNQDAFDIYEELTQLYPTSSYIKTQLAIALYNLQGMVLHFSEPPTSADNKTPLLQILQLRKVSLRLYSSSTHID